MSCFWRSTRHCLCNWLGVENTWITWQDCMKSWVKMPVNCVPFPDCKSDDVPFPANQLVGKCRTLVWIVIARFTEHCSVVLKTLLNGTWESSMSCVGFSIFKKTCLHYVIEVSPDNSLSSKIFSIIVISVFQTVVQTAIPLFISLSLLDSHVVGG